MAMLKRKEEGKEERALTKEEPSREISPFEEMERWFDEMLRRPFSMIGPPWWRRYGGMETETISSSVDMYEEGDNIVVKAEIPGLAKEDLDIKLTDEAITIAGEKKREKKIERKNYFRSECSYGSFCRTLRFPTEIQSEKAKAKFKNGVLEVKIPKSEEAKMRERKLQIE